MPDLSARATARVGLVISMVFCVLFVAGSAFAQRRYPPGPPTVLPTQITRSVEPKDEVKGKVLRRDEGILPLTGGDLMLFVLGGGGAVATGMGVVRATRRRKS